MGKAETSDGIGVDASGHPTIDPTRNVLDLVAAESKYQNDMRDAESRRIDGLAELKQSYDARINDILAVQVKTASELISAQLDRATAILSSQTASAAVQQTSLISTLSDRIYRLEQARWEGAGRSRGLGDSWGALIAVFSVLIAIGTLVAVLLKH